MAPPTHEDAQLMVQLAQWGTDLGLNEAVAELMGPSFDPGAVDETNPAVRTVLVYGESIGTLTKHGLLSAELVHDWLWIEGMWSRVGPAAVKARERHGEPRLFENFEALAQAG
jgi:hypothetical protein